MGGSESQQPQRDCRLLAAHDTPIRGGNPAPGAPRQYMESSVCSRGVLDPSSFSGNWTINVSPPLSKLGTRHSEHLQERACVIFPALFVPIHSFLCTESLQPTSGVCEVDIGHMSTKQQRDKTTRHIRIDAGLHRRLKIRAAQEGRPLIRIVNALVERFLQSVSVATSPTTHDDEKD